MKYLLTILIITLSLCLKAQQIEYVKAKNGLNLRAEPNLNSNKLGKLDFGAPVTLLDRTETQLSVEDQGSTIRGNWVKVKYESIIGFVFDGYLTSGFKENSYSVDFDGIQLVMDINNWDEDGNDSKIHTDTAIIIVELEGNAERKLIKINNSTSSSVEIFQRHENSVTIKNEGPHCDMVNWKHYNSEWIKLEIKDNWILTNSYSEEDRSKFPEIDINDLIKEVSNQCGENWGALIKNIKSVNEYNSSVSISKIYLKLVMKDTDGNEKTKYVIFDIPMGC